MQRPPIVDESSEQMDEQSYHPLRIHSTNDGHREQAAQLERRNTTRPASNPLNHPPSDDFTVVPVPGISGKKRHRRRYDEIERIYTCGWEGCEKSYGWLNNLNAHVSWHGHGPKRLPEGKLSSFLIGYFGLLAASEFSRAKNTRNGRLFNQWHPRLLSKYIGRILLTSGFLEFQELRKERKARQRHNKQKAQKEARSKSEEDVDASAATATDGQPSEIASPYDGLQIRSEFPPITYPPIVDCPADDAYRVTSSDLAAPTENVQQYFYGGYAASAEYGSGQPQEMVHIQQFGFGKYSASPLDGLHPQQSYAGLGSVPIEEHNENTGADTSGKISDEGAERFVLGLIGFGAVAPCSLNETTTRGE